MLARSWVRCAATGAGLDWLTDRAADTVDGVLSIFRLDVHPFTPVQVKLVRDDGRFMVGRNAVISRGDQVVLRPSFDRVNGDLSGLRALELPWGGGLHVRVRLPPSYAEQEQLRYPVLVLPGRPVGVERRHRPVRRMGARPRPRRPCGSAARCREFIVVSVDTGNGRLERLRPVPDPGRTAAARTAPVTSAAWSRCSSR